MRCPVHDVKLKHKMTKYGLRFDCFVPGCDIMAWEGSTPANQETRTARHEAHKVFDPLWKGGPLRRKQAYSRLAKHMGLSKKKTHISQFDLEQCQQVMKFCDEFVRTELL